MTVFSLICTEILMKMKPLIVWSFCHSSDSLPVGSEDHEAACGGVSHMLLSDILVPAVDESAEHNLHKEALSVGLQEDSVKVCSCVLTGL